MDASLLSFTQGTGGSAEGAGGAARAAHAHRPGVVATKVWRISLGASILLHGAAMSAVLFSLAQMTPSAKSADSVMTVELAPSPSAPVAPPRQTPPGPQRIASVEKPKPVDQPKIPPPPMLTSPVNPEVVMRAKPDAQPDRPVLKQVSDQTTAPEALAAPPKSNLAAPTTGASSVATNAPQTWDGLVLAKMQRNKRYPGAAQSQGQQDVVYLRMGIDRSGRLTNADVVRSRGYTLLDNEAVALAHRSSPFPAPPANEEGNPVVVVVPVEFFINRHPGR